jgi:type IV pilus assembly protein PilB
MARTLLGELLLATGHISESQLKSAMVHQDKWGSRIGESLVALGYVDERTMLQVLARQMGVPFIEIGDTRFPRALVGLLPAHIIRKRHVFPVGLRRAQGARPGRLVVAITDPTDLGAIDDLAFACGHAIDAVLASPSDVDRAIDRHLDGLRDHRARAIDLPPDPGPIEILVRGKPCPR